jgi:glycosyltransferase involved in cell wall biosynthesis
MNRIHSIMLVKNEADVVGHCLTEAVRWSDFVYVYDNGSDDGTWDIVQSMRSEQIIPFQQNHEPYCEGMRAEVFNRYKDRCGERDWWCKLDAHEFYADDPRAFLAAVSQHRHTVWGLFIQYYLTNEDLDEIDFTRPCEEVLPQLRYYNANYSELRFFRHRDRLVWKTSDAWPGHLGLANERLIRFKHYPYRSPDQIQIRLDVRRAARERGAIGFDTATETHWRSKVASRDGLSYDANDGRYLVDPAAARAHIGPSHKRFAQTLLHRAGIWP